MPFPGASFPLPLTFSCISSTTPAGIGIFTVSSITIRPCTSAPFGLLSIVCPDPPQD